eukprot:TRINITY_DN1048_c2_g1_i2.p1 TRINITY_DN1048_c2_g1~~TRINITY_DN1048_c2_g1_i2.p1  ORF type:complete len:434 (-),score=142.54 TRINITY_DN1048_c2_g1_i2:83-1384(-)
MDDKQSIYDIFPCIDKKVIDKIYLENDRNVQNTIEVLLTHEWKDIESDSDIDLLHEEHKLYNNLEDHAREQEELDVDNDVDVDNDDDIDNESNNNNNNEDNKHTTTNMLNDLNELLQSQNIDHLDQISLTDPIEELNIDLYKSQMLEQIKTDEELAKQLQGELNNIDYNNNNNNNNKPVINPPHNNNNNNKNNNGNNNNSHPFGKEYLPKLREEYNLPFDLTKSWLGANELKIKDDLNIVDEHKLMKLARKYCRKSDDPNNIKIYKVMKPTLLKKFEEKQREFSEKYDSIFNRHRAKPVMAFHGSKSSLIQSIMNIGLVIPGIGDGKGIPHSTDSGWYGNGIYLTPDFKRARAYGNRVLVCSVLLGRMYRCSSFIELSGKEGVKPGYDSHREASFNLFYGREYVVFDPAQVLPCYLIEFDGTSSPYMISDKLF